MKKRENCLYPVMVIVTIELLLLFLFFRFFIQNKTPFSKKVLAIETLDLCDAKPEAGAEKDSIELPKYFVVLISENSEEKNTEEKAEITWEGYYDGGAAGEYVLTSAFRDDNYVFEGEMPQIKVTIEE